MQNRIVKAALLASFATCALAAVGKTTAVQKAPPDQRGTQESPLVVKGPIDVRVEPDQNSEQEAAENREGSALKSRELLLSCAIALAAIVQAMAACVQIRIYVRQSSLMAGSLNATRDSAHAALINAQAVMNADRAWMIIEDIQGPHASSGESLATLSVQYINHG
jgi:hypothetical protein